MQPDDLPALLGGPAVRPQGPPDWPPPDDDVLQALHAAYPRGAWGRYHDAGVLSFGGSKLLSAGRGGALLTRRADVHQRARVALSRGNVVCPLSELQAAVLLPQLARLDERNAARARSVARLTELLADVPG